MTKNDEWVREWTVYWFKIGANAAFGPVQFSLKASTASYTVDSVVDVPGDPVPWKILVFYPHGEKDPTCKKGILDPWNSGNDSKWGQAATDVRTAATLLTKRLEGTFPGHDVVLLRCDGAVKDKTPLLVVQIIPIVSDVFPGGIRQDGTGHGGHPP